MTDPRRLFLCRSIHRRISATQHQATSHWSRAPLMPARVVCPLRMLAAKLPRGKKDFAISTAAADVNKATRSIDTHSLVEDDQDCIILRHALSPIQVGSWELLDPGSLSSIEAGLRFFPGSISWEMISPDSPTRLNLRTKFGAVTINQMRSTRIWLFLHVPFNLQATDIFASSRQLRELYLIAGSLRLTESARLRAQST
jgi:hypothetical protein